MTNTKRNKMPIPKDTRWDRIRKKYSNSVTFKSDTVKRIIEKDYIGKYHSNLLNGEVHPELKLDPITVMDLRHEMFKKIPRKLPLATVAFSKTLDACKAHNIAVEDHYIENQLNQFRLHLQKQHKRYKIPEKKVHSLLIDNAPLMEGLKTSQKHIENFYNVPLDALEEVEKFMEEEKCLEKSFVQKENSELEDVVNSRENLRLDNKEIDETEKLNDANIDAYSFTKDLTDDNNEDSHRTPSPLENTDEILKPFREALDVNTTKHHLRCVRFDEEVDVYQLNRECSNCSNTSDGMDSVISDLAEEALRELQLEEEIKNEQSSNDKQLEEIHKEDEQKIKVQILKNQMQSTLPQNEENSLMITGQTPDYVKRAMMEQNIVTNSEQSTDEDNDTESYSNHEQNKIIEQLFQSRTSQTRIAIMRQYFLKWVHFTTIEKIEREHLGGRADRVKMINVFLDKIRIEKTRLKRQQITDFEQGNTGNQGEIKKKPLPNVRITKKYQNKIKVQQDIIDFQRLKLERQERIIMELKLSKLSEEAREARLELKKELKAVIQTGDAKSKAKAKCLQLIGNLKDEEDEQLAKLQGKALIMPKFLQQMHERSLERSIRHEQAKQRRLQIEADKEALKMAQEEAKRMEDEEAKRMRIEALKEKRRQEKMAKILKERERQRQIDNQRKAQEFCRRLLLKRVGMEGFKRLLQRKRENARKCEELRKSLYKRAYFQAWFSIYRKAKARRLKKAEELCKKITKRNAMQSWLWYVEEERSKYNVAVDWYSMKLSESMFRKWFDYTMRMKMIEESKMKQARSHHEWHLKWKVLDCWQRLPQILQLEKVTEERRQRWRLKIWELLPDYTPNRDELDFV